MDEAVNWDHFHLGFYKGEVTSDQAGPCVTATTTTRDWETLELMNALARKKCKHLQSCVRHLTVCESSWQDTPCHSQEKDQTLLRQSHIPANPFSPGRGRSRSTLSSPCAPQHAGQTPVAPTWQHRAASPQGRALAGPPSATFHLQMNISRLVGHQEKLRGQFRTLLAAAQGLCSGFPLSPRQVHLSRQKQGGLSWWRSRAGCAGGAAEPTQTLKTVGQMLQQLRHRIFLQGSPTSSPAEPREGRWELLHQPPTQGHARGSAQHKPGAGTGGQPEEQGDAHSS